MPLKTWVSGEKVLASDLNSNFAQFGVADSIDMVLGHDMPVANKPVYVADGAETNVELTQSSGASNIDNYLNASTDRMAQSFTLPVSGTIHQRLSQVTLYMNKQGSPTGNLTIELYAVDGSGKPTGSILASGTIAYSSISGGATNYNVSMSAYDMTPGTQYIFVANPGAGASVGNHAVFYFGPSSNPYSGGKMWLSTDSGSTWVDNDIGESVASGDDIRFGITCVSIAGRVYQTSALTAEDSDNFIGFNAETGTVGQTKSIRITSGSLDGFSGLTIGSIYYLNDTRGTIGTSAGTVSRKIGIAISATQLLMIRDHF